MAQSLTKKEMEEDEEFDNQLGHSYDLGISVGLERAGGILMEEAMEYFKMNQDTEAKKLRTLAEKLIKLGKTTHPNKD